MRWWVGFCFCLVPLASSSHHHLKSQKLNHRDSWPDVVMVVVDDAGWNDIGYHNEDFHTPNLDGLAAEGVRLENLYTDRQCTPARAQLMTGRYNIHTSMQDNVIYSLEPRGLPLHFKLLPEKLSEVGYDTLGVGKWHLGHFQESYCPWKRGFDRWFGNLLSGGDHEDHTQNSERWFVRSNSATTHYDGVFEGYYLVEGTANLGYEAIRDAHQGVHSTELYTTRAMDYLRMYTSTERPYFLFLAYQAVHPPLMVSKEWLASGDCDKKGFDGTRSLVCGMMSQLDFWQGSLVNFIKDRGTWNNTLYVFLSDNGANPGYGGSNDPLRGGKGDYWDGGVKSPVFISGGFLGASLAAAKSPPAVNGKLMHITDIPATLLHLAGIAVDDLDGVNQWHAMVEQGSHSGRDELLINVNSEMYGLAGAIRVGKYKYIKYPEPLEDDLFWSTIETITDEPVIDHTTFRNTIDAIRTAVWATHAEADGTYIFDMDQNPGERTDGDCDVFEECNSLAGHNSAYRELHSRLRSRFLQHVTTMVASGVAFQNDGVLANPAYFNGSIGIPWRDNSGVPFAAADLSSFITDTMSSSGRSVNDDDDDDDASRGASMLAAAATPLSGLSPGAFPTWVGAFLFVVANIFVTVATVVATRRWSSRRPAYSAIPDEAPL